MSQKLLEIKKQAKAREEQLYTRYAAFSKDHKRFYDEDQDYRLPYKRDVDRIVNSKAYSRYNDKTQVIYLVLDDHLTSRSLHVQLVSNLARSIGSRLLLNEDLIEAIALGHDTGHAPFGHEGEDYLSALSLEFGGYSFVHNVQSCHLLSDIEPLNLGLAVYDGFLCHSGGLVNRILKPDFTKTWATHLKEIEERKRNVGAHFFPMTKEGCLVKLCDKISYIGKDIEDALRLDLIKKEDIPKTLLGTSNQSILHAVVNDLLVHSCNGEEIILSEEVFESLKELRQFNFEKIYNHSKLKVESGRIKRAYRYLMEFLLEDYEKNNQNSHLYLNYLIDKKERYLQDTSLVQKVVDYIAGMTDRYFVNTVEKFLVPKRIII
jgi:dGTPase